MFKIHVEHALEHEKYWSDHPKDRGGLTIWGIASATWPEEVARMRTMSQGESREYAKGFYWQHFWTPIHGDDLEQIAGTDLAGQVFDFAVTSSPATSIKALQRTINLSAMAWDRDQVAVDGIIGPRTLAALRTAMKANAARYTELFPKVFRFFRMRHYYEIAAQDRTQLAFIEGWLIRA